MIFIKVFKVCALVPKDRIVRASMHNRRSNSYMTGSYHKFHRYCSEFRSSSSFVDILCLQVLFSTSLDALHLWWFVGLSLLFLTLVQKAGFDKQNSFTLCTLLHHLESRAASWPQLFSKKERRFCFSWISELKMSTQTISLQQFNFSRYCTQKSFFSEWNH